MAVRRALPETRAPLLLRVIPVRRSTAQATPPAATVAAVWAPAQAVWAARLRRRSLLRAAARRALRDGLMRRAARAAARRSARRARAVRRAWARYRRARAAPARFRSPVR